MDEVDLAMRHVILWQRFRASVEGRDAQKRADDMVNAEFEKWAADDDIREQRDKRERDRRLEVLKAVPRTYPKVKRGMLLVMPPRLRWAKHPDQCLRLLAQPVHRIERYVWQWVVLHQRFVPDQCFYRDIADDFDGFTEWQADLMLAEKVARQRQAFFNASFRAMKKYCQEKRIPIEAELLGDTVFWQYSGSRMSGVEIEWMNRRFSECVRRDLGRWEPDRSRSWHGPIQVGVILLTGSERALDNAYPSLATG